MGKYDKNIELSYITGIIKKVVCYTKNKCGGRRILMAKCTHCGNIVPDGQQVCAVCGAAMNNNGNNNMNQNYSNVNYSNQNYQNQNYSNQNYSNQGYSNQNNANQGYQGQGYQNQGYQNQDYSNQGMAGADTTYMYDPMDIQQNKAMAILSYIGILCLIPLFANHTSRYARFHTVQGFNLFLISMIIGAVRGVGRVAFGYFTIAASLWGGLCSLLSIAVFVFMILGIINAAQGKAKELPIIGQLHIIHLF